MKDKSKQRFREKNGSWKGGRRVGKGGYIHILCPDHPFITSSGYVLEHRLIMEKHLGRYLTKNEIIHHINGNPADNRLENLKLCEKNTHMKEHILKERWSRKYDKCVRCGTSDGKHAGHGLCIKCYSYLYEVRNRGYETEHDKDGKRIFSEEHRKNLSKSMIGNTNNPRSRKEVENEHEQQD